MNTSLPGTSRTDSQYWASIAGSCTPHHEWGTWTWQAVPRTSNGQLFLERMLLFHRLFLSREPETHLEN